MTEAVSIRYRAFLSYSHRDAAWGKWLHSALEGYRIDKDLIARPTPAGPVPKTLRPIFRDREDFSAGHSLTAQTLAALEASQFLIVICSPNAAQSKYVNEEIRRFKALGRGDCIIPVIVAGEPGDPERECSPPALRHKLDAHGAPTDEREEPIAADARSQGDGKDMARQKVIAGLLGLGLDEIVRRAERARRRRNRFWTALAGVFLVLAVGASGSAVYAWQQLKTNEAFLNATLQRATEIVNAAVAQAEKYNVPRTATLELLARAEGMFDDMARLGRPTPELHYRKALMLLEFAHNYEILGKTDLQLARAEEAHQLVRGLLTEQPSDPELQRRLVFSYTALGDALEKQGRLPAALAQHQAAVAIAQRFAFGNPLTSGAWQSLGVSYQRLGDILKKQGSLDEARKYYRAQLDIDQRLYAANPTDDALRNLSVAYERIGDVLHLAFDKHDEALVEFRKAQDINRQLVTKDPANSAWQRDLHVSHGKIGAVLLVQGKLEAALAEYRTGLAISERLADKDPSHAGWQRDLAISHGMIGDVLMAKRSTQEAMARYRSRLAIFERLTAGDPRNANWQIDLANSHALIADAHVAEGKVDDALASYRASHDLWETAVRNHPSNLQWQLDCLWSHSRLAVLGDDPAERLQFIVTTLRRLKDEKRLTPNQERWLPFAEEALAAADPANKHRQWSLLGIYWRTASFTPNPVGQAALVVAMARKLKDENQLSSEQVRWLAEAEAHVATLQTAQR